MANKTASIAWYRLLSSGIEQGRTISTRVRRHNLSLFAAISYCWNFSLPTLFSFSKHTYFLYYFLQPAAPPEARQGGRLAMATATLVLRKIKKKKKPPSIHPSGHHFSRIICSIMGLEFEFESPASCVLVSLPSIFIICDFFGGATRSTHLALSRPAKKEEKKKNNNKSNMEWEEEALQKGYWAKGEVWIPWITIPWHFK